jgi:hypothetical protein
VDVEDTECYCYKLKLHWCNGTFCPPPSADVTMEYLLGRWEGYTGQGTLTIEEAME